MEGMQADTDWPGASGASRGPWANTSFPYRATQPHSYTFTYMTRCTL